MAARDGALRERCSRPARLRRNLLPFIVTLLAASPCGWAGEPGPDAVLRTFDFGGSPHPEPIDWLEDLRFELKHHFTDSGKIELSRRADGLHVRTRKKAFGIMLHEEDIPGARHLRLHWGVSDYPDGASWERGVDDEAIMVYVFFGHETFDSGSFIIPDSPYFLGFFLCAPGTDRLEKPYEGRYFHKSGRYICVDHPEPGVAAVSEVDLAEEFRSTFGLDTVPTVSGISIEVDTTHERNDGYAAAFISRLEFLE